MQTLKQYIEEKQEGKSGTYAAMNFAPISAYQIAKYVSEHRIPSPVPPEKLHVTLMYSRRTLVGYQSQGEIAPMPVRVIGFDVWDTHDGKKALVARLDAPELEARHRYLMDTYNGTYDFPDYKPHFTMSYDVGPGWAASKMPLFEHPLYLDHEYSKPLDLDWTPDK